MTNLNRDETKKMTYSDAEIPMTSTKTNKQPTDWFTWKNIFC